MLVIAALTVLGACTEATGPEPTIEIDGELLFGKRVADGRVAAFLGVPFAEPPVGDLRWRAPQPLGTKIEHRDVTEFAPACMQTMRILDWYRYLAETFGGSRDYYPDLEVSEDCLYLNVWTPSLEADMKLPVMVWFHGGSNRSGWSYEPNYHGHELAQKGVVVVSVGYRQGLFGFLALPDSAGGDAAANFALWDMIASLRWIRDNIEHFGGDAQRVTAFGESAGAQDILALMFARPAKGLFHRAILQSNAGFGLDRTSTLAAERQRLIELARLLDVPGTSHVGRLLEAPASDLLTVYEEAFADYYHSPAVDGELLTESVWASIQAGRFADHQLMIGTNADEWLDDIDPQATSEDVAHTAEELRHMDGSAALVIVSSESNPREAMDRLITAEKFLCPAQHTAARLTEAGGDAWMYFFTRVREGEAGERLGAYHGAEYPYVFDTHDSYMITNEIDRALTTTMMDYWVQFAATGDPNSGRTPDWPKFAAPQFPVQELGDEVRTIGPPEPQLCALFEEWNAGRD